MFLQTFYIIIDSGISSPGHVRELVDVLITIDKSFIFQLMSNVQLLGKKGYDTQMVMHTGIRTSGVSLAR